ncbi:DUF1963 domain-containing protein [Nocardiopsis suaedae]|uniref:DUF1963 domain-containing protein n=1 Tax=Nocardiopsis suaedae TaxID=3018444 RepID=A0ABT4TT96_9ACTN|nr:DUF1963 domain-containing protein [Nocardiopsis suaedae]MDA2807470.1 DUF1963 domain-containing protein [Nocardiopsis suaedae]
MSDDSTNEDRFRAEAASRDLPADETEAWIRAALPAVYIGGGEAPGGQPVARLGGNPMLPRDTPDPPSPFIASLDCAALPLGATGLPFPSEGHLLLFADPADRRQGPAPGEVVYVPAGSATAARPVGERAPFTEKRTARSYQRLEPQSHESFTVDRWGPAPDDEHFELAEELDDAWRDVHGLPPGWDLQVGGHTIVLQNDPVHWAREQDAGDWALLATWRCGDDVTELDGGVVHWVIRREDLAALRFDRVHRYTDMA